MTLVTDKSYFRRQAIGSGSNQYLLVQWLDLFFAQCPTWTPILPFVQQGLAYSLEMPLPFSVVPPPLPDGDKASRYTAIFFSRIHPVFPVLELHSFTQSLADLANKLSRQPETMESQDYPLLACAYAVFSAAADEEASSISADGTHYLQAAYSLYAHLVAAPYLASVQALLLLSLILRNRSKDGASWSSLGQAICIAQSLGLHRHVLYTMSTQVSLVTSRADSPASPTAAHPTDGDLNSRIWWTAYTLERSVALETGRPSLIREEECDQIIPNSLSAPLGSGISFDYFRMLILLAQIKGRAIDHLYGCKKPRRSVRALLFEMGRIDRALVDWADSFRLQFGRC